MTLWLLVPLALQAVLMFFDEMVFHRRRGLPRWERIGHPLDTLTVALCYAWGVFRDPSSPHALPVFIALAALSCIFVTKDELVHSQLCSPSENWLHAMLFVVHPIVLGCFAIMWREHQHPRLLQLQLVATVGLAVFQMLFWSPLWNRTPFRSDR